MECVGDEDFIDFRGADTFIFLIYMFFFVFLHFSGYREADEGFES